MSQPAAVPMRPTAAFVGASWFALLLALTCFAVGLWNAGMTLSEKGFYGTVLLLGLFAAVALQKSVRDRIEGIPVTSIFLGLAWAMVLTSIVLMAAGLSNAAMTLSEKGFYGLAFAMALFAAVAVQKNIRDAAAAGPHHLDPPAETAEQQLPLR